MTSQIQSIYQLPAIQHDLVLPVDEARHVEMRDLQGGALQGRQTHQHGICFCKLVAKFGDGHKGKITVGGEAKNE